MTCRNVKLAKGTTAIVCTRGQRKRRCRCGETATLLCDFVLYPMPMSNPPKPLTCDKPLCRRCAVSVGPDRDHCPDHGDRMAT